MSQRAGANGQRIWHQGEGQRFLLTEFREIYKRKELFHEPVSPVIKAPYSSI
jgi:hypothetical protein